MFAEFDHLIRQLVLGAFGSRHPTLVMLQWQWSWLVSFP
jgi:hypothetical protein